MPRCISFYNQNEVSLSLTMLNSVHSYSVMEMDDVMGYEDR